MMNDLPNEHSHYKKVSINYYSDYNGRNIMKIKKRVTKKGLLVVCLVFSMLMASISVQAKNRNEWEINYTPKDYYNPNNKQASIAYEYYYGRGYYGYCNSISGTNGRRLTITALNAGGMKEGSVDVTTTGRTVDWHLRTPISGEVQYQVLASASYSCVSKGIIKLNR